jgi:beta-1,2-mannobiose phosphorylase / 1,2-beta-oligomannan phosphorylase
MSFHEIQENPILGPGYTVSALFDMSVMEIETGLRMWLSWRDTASIAVSDSADGVHWTAPRIVLEVDKNIDWESEAINRPHVLKAGDRFYMWYTGQNFTNGRGAIGLAVSDNGLSWTRVGNEPVLAPAADWEKTSLMCPFVLHEERRFRMWYSGGEMYEADAIGYAESDDGITWRRPYDKPVFTTSGKGWESDRVAAGSIVRDADSYLLFYVGFASGFEKSSIGVARSKDGVSGWESFPGNPIMEAGKPGSWSDCNVYKPFVLKRDGEWYMWFNASRHSDRREQIGLAIGEPLQW